MTYMSEGGPGPKSILIVRLSSIGDVVRTLPALSSLRRQFPHAHIAWAIEDKSSGLLRQHPLLDEAIVFERAEFVRSIRNPLTLPSAISLLLRFLKNLRSRTYDVVFDFHGILKSGVLVALSHSSKKVGFEKQFVKELNHLFTNYKVGVTDAKLPRVERNLQLIKDFVSSENLIDRATLHLSERDRDKATAFVRDKFDDSHPLIAIHPGTSRDLKKWPLRSHARLCDLLAESLGAKVMLTWGPGELEEVQQICSLAKSSPGIGMHTESLLELAALFETCDLAVTVDSGPMHIASAVGTPLVAIFGPTDIRINAPYWQPNRVLTGNLDCSPCDEDCDSARCMDAVKPEDVVEAARDLLAHAGSG